MASPHCRPRLQLQMAEIRSLLFVLVGILPIFTPLLIFLLLIFYACKCLADQRLTLLLAVCCGCPLT